MIRDGKTDALLAHLGAFYHAIIVPDVAFGLLDDIEIVFFDFALGLFDDFEAVISN
jgi:hypothetical protein